MRLIHRGTGLEAKIGDLVTIGDKIHKLEYFRKPSSPASEGKVTVDGRPWEVYCSVVGLEWVEREDREFLAQEVSELEVVEDKVLHFKFRPIYQSEGHNLCGETVYSSENLKADSQWNSVTCLECWKQLLK